MSSKVKYYEEIYKTRSDYKRDLEPMYENITAFLTFKPNSVLDYGCGRGNLADLFAKNYGSNIYKYDPAIAEFSEFPTGNYELAVNTDVLEHVPEEEIDGIIKNIRALCQNAFFNVHLSHASEILSNGENAHCTIKPPHWWLQKVKRHFPQAYIVPSNYPNSCSIITWKPSAYKIFQISIKNALSTVSKKIRSLKNILKTIATLPNRLFDFLHSIRSIQLENLKLQDMQYRDMLDLYSGFKKIRHNEDIILQTDHPVAYDSPDHINPLGTIQDNTRNYAFYKKCRDLFGPDMSFLDLGCSGGGLVFDFALNGHVAIGLEGSDRSKKMGRANWRTIPNNLFTCDITKPFNLITAKSGAVVTFDVISCWEVLEHIPEKDLPQLIENVKNHLSNGGIFVGSISKSPEDPLHVTLHENAWWVEKFKIFNLSMEIGYDGVFEFKEFCRGIEGGIFDSHNYRSDPHKGFHFIARKM